MTAWSPWSSCGGACGAISNKTRSRSLEHKPHPRHLGTTGECKEPVQEFKSCLVKCESQSEMDVSKLKFPSRGETNSSPAVPSDITPSIKAVPKAKDMPLPSTSKTDVPLKAAGVETPRAQSESKAPSLPKSDVPQAPKKAESIEAQTPPTATSKIPASYRVRLERFYKKYNPQMLTQVDKRLEEFKGREEELFNALVTKYDGPEPEE